MIPATELEIKQMLASIGASSVEELFLDIPESVRLKKKLNLPAGMSERELRNRLGAMAAKNRTLDDQVSFLGAGIYRHDIPSAIGALISRGEFATAYTPYQSEASQGTLQAIYEFQTLICRLVGMDVANASHYDGATSLAEAALMAIDITQREKVLVSRAVHPDYRGVVQTYLKGRNLLADEVSLENGRTSLKEAEKLLSGGKVSTLIIQYPNFFGALEEIEALAELCTKHGALLVTAVVEPIALGLLSPPGERGAAIIAGEGQSLGIPTSFGGPHVGFIATKKEHIRRIPGRLVGRSLDKNGNPAFTLTLQAREQHIRRDKAASNVCTNQSLCAVANAIFLSLLGKEGFREASSQCYHKAHFAMREWTKSGALKPLFPSTPFYHEFAVKVPGRVSSFLESMLKENILAGYSLENDYPEYPGAVLLTVTEVNRRDEIDLFTGKLSACLNEKKVGCSDEK